MRLVFELSANVFAVHASDVAEADVLRAFSSASTSVGTVAEAEFVHLRNHSLSAASCFSLALRKEGELANLSRNEQHSRTVFTSSNAATATDASSRVHCFVGNVLRDCDSVGVLSAAAVE